jgi:hypothetical protein
MFGGAFRPPGTGVSLLWQANDVVAGGYTGVVLFANTMTFARQSGLFDRVAKARHLPDLP